jgi:hypothetical protein
MACTVLRDDRGNLLGFVAFLEASMPDHFSRCRASLPDATEAEGTWPPLP